MSLGLELSSTLFGTSFIPHAEPHHFSHRDFTGLLEFYGLELIPLIVPCVVDSSSLSPKVTSAWLDLHFHLNMPINIDVLCPDAPTMTLLQFGHLLLDILLLFVFLLRVFTIMLDPPWPSAFLSILLCS